MNKIYVKMKNVDLYYPSAIYNALTIKQVIFNKLTGRKHIANALDDIYALRNFTLEVKEGERLGVIGLNGAGKSTLLKAVAGLYPIRNGEIEINGEIRALLELSLGFDPESTGRENILYRGLMLGWTPKQIKEIEGEVISFADLGEFIDYPVRSYSSGMMVRLAFAISTTITGEILLVDEILSAGDISFQAKAKKRMLNVMSQAKILVLVLHDMNTIEEICSRVILLNRGSICEDGEPRHVIKEYKRMLALK